MCTASEKRLVNNIILNLQMWKWRCYNPSQVIDRLKEDTGAKAVNLYIFIQET